MNPKSLSKLLCLLSLIALAAPLLRAQDMSAWPHTFTSTDGRQLRAVMISKTDTNVTVRKPEGGPPLVLPLDRLSAADQAFVKAWTPPPTPAPAAAVRPRNAASGPVAGKLVIVPINDGAKINPLGAGMLEKEPLKDSLFVDVSAAGHHVVAVTEDGKAICFGMNQDGKPMVDVLPKTKRKMVACTAGEFVDFLIDKDGRFEVMRGESSIPERQKLKRIFESAKFGLDREDHLQYIGPASERATYDVPPELKNVVVQDLSFSGSHVVALTKGGSILVWGKTGQGQLPLPPELSGSDAKVAAVTVDGSATIVVRTNGEILNWGEGRTWWGSTVKSAPGTVDAWGLWDGYWATKVFRQETDAGISYTIFSKSPERDAYLQKVLDQYKPVKLTQTKDAIVMICLVVP